MTNTSELLQALSSMQTRNISSQEKQKICNSLGIKENWIETLKKLSKLKVAHKATLNFRRKKLFPYIIKQKTEHKMIKGLSPQKEKPVVY